jgi:hypothetical protein
MKNQPEFQLQKQVCNYLNLKYKDVLFLSDTIAFLHLTIPQRVRNSTIQKRGFHCPDIIIFKPNSKFNGLFLELKAKSPFKKDGCLLKSEHLANQQQTIDQLNEMNYFATFAVGFEETKTFIDWYMTLK